MVSFICDACGNSVRKNQVEKHYLNSCRNCSVLSCIDCGVDFPGDAYLTHTSCISEAEKYQGHLYQAKDKENKGDAKQKEWLKHVHGTSGSTTDPRLKSLLNRLSAYSNIPRKRKKFDNFCKNSVNVYDTKTLDQLWDLFNTKPAAEAPPAAPPADEKPAIKEDSEKDSDSDSDEDTKKNETPEKVETPKETETPVETPESDEPKKKKKKKKDKKSTLDENVEATDTKENENVQDEKPVENGNEVDEENTKKKKKKKRKLVEENDNSNGNNNSENINGTTEINGTEEKENKKKKKGKKHKMNGTVEHEEVSCKKKKKNDIEEINNVKEEQEEEEEVAPQGKFHWHKAIKTVLKQSEDNEISIKKLRKKVLAAYQEHGLDHRASTIDESQALFDKKLKTYPKVKIAKDIVKLVK